MGNMLTQNSGRTVDGNLRPFTPSKSGNPGGRPKVLEKVRRLARQHTVEAIEILVDVARNAKKHPPARVTAAIAILDRGWGKPTQAVAGEDGQPTKIVEAGA
jgi:hypothetical protein